MYKLIFDIYHGNYEVLDRPYDTTSEEKRILQKIENLEELLKNLLPEESRSLLSQYSELFMELMVADGEGDYLAGFRLGVQMMLAAWPICPQSMS